jgi:hypothetical protein
MANSFDNYALENIGSGNGYTSGFNNGNSYTSGSNPKYTLSDSNVKDNTIFNNYKEKNDIMIINCNENIRHVMNNVQWEALINYIKPRLIIITSQYSKNTHIQTEFKTLFDGTSYKLLAKVDSLRESDSGVTGYMKSFVQSTYSLKTRIYYNEDTVCVGFNNSRLPQQSSFANKSNSFNNMYNSNTYASKSNSNNDSKMTIEKYYMKRSTSRIKPTYGIGRITIGLKIKYPDSERKSPITLIISNYNDKLKTTFSTTQNSLFSNNKALVNSGNLNGKSNQTSENVTSNTKCAITISPENTKIYPNFPENTSYSSDLQNSNSQYFYVNNYNDIVTIIQTYFYN